MNWWYYCHDCGKEFQAETKSATTCSGCSSTDIELCATAEEVENLGMDLELETA